MTAAEDIRAQAPTHVLFIPLNHIATVNDLTMEDREQVGHLHLAVAPHAPRERHLSAADVHLDPPRVDLGIFLQVLDDDVVDLVVGHGGEVVQVAEVVPRHPSLSRQK